ncbi:disulfide bond formation protein B [Candidatus Peribacteria bacterium]|nr:disulfide bond formation protein B [Candidatus Peribacteria bacterium]
MRSLVSKHALILMFVVALVATSGSLFFSEIALFAPCKDCWFQRIFMYPQVILLAVALWRKDRTIAWYILALCIVGGALSLDHYSDQWEAILNPIEHDPLAPCDLSGVSCSATYIFELGYITIPLMAATAFLLNALGSITVVLSTNAKKK